MGISRSAAAATAAVALMALTGCDFSGESRLEYSDTEQVRIAEVRIDGGSGDVTVRTADIDEVRIKRVVRYRGGEEPGTGYRLDGEALLLSTSCGHLCSVSYDVEAPDGVRVRGDNGSGDLSLTNVGDVDVRLSSGTITISGAGAVQARTGSGDVIVSNVSGPATLDTGSGNIEGLGLGGAAVTVETGSGDIELTLDRPGAVQARTGSGNATLTVPQGSYRVRTDTGSGDVESTLTDEPDGEHLLEVRTGSGDISLIAR